MSDRVKLPHVATFLICEVICRSARRILDKHFTHLIYKSGEQMNDQIRHQDLDEDDKQYIREQYAQFEYDLAELAIKILNYVVSFNEESEIFWERMLKPQCYIDFQYMFKPEFDRRRLPVGLMVSLCQHHFNITLKDRMYAAIGKQDTFTIEDFHAFNFKPKCYSLTKHKIRTYAGYFPRFRNIGQISIALKLISVTTDIEESLGRQLEVKEAAVETADLQLLAGDYPFSSELCKKGIAKYGTYSPWCIKFISIMFRQMVGLKNEQRINELYNIGLTLIAYNFGTYHPLLSMFDSYMA